MIGPDVEVVHLQVVQFDRILASLSAQSDPEGPPPETRILLLVHEGGVLRKAILAGKRVDPTTLSFSGPDDLPRLRALLGASAAIALSPSALPELMRRAEGGYQLDRPMVDQLLTLLRAWQSLLGEHVHMDPPGPFAGIRLPSPGNTRRVMRWLLPPGRVAVFYAVEQHGEDRRIAASLILRQGRRGGLDFITSDAFLGQEGLDPARWREEASRITAQVEQHLGPVHLSVFGEISALVELVVAGGNLGLMSTAVHTERLVVQHRPLWLKALLSPTFGRFLTGPFLRRFMGGR